MLSWGQRFGAAGSQAQLPAGLLLNLLYGCAWVIGLEHSLPVFRVKCEESQCSDQRGRASSRQAGASPPRCTGWAMLTGVTITRACGIIDALAEAVVGMLHDYGKP